MRKSSKEYWAERARQREQESYQRGSRLTAKLFNEYQKAAESIRKNISDYYARYAKKHGVTYEEAMKRLNRREAQEWKKSVEEYLKEISAEADPKERARLRAQYDALSYNSSISRLDALLGQIDMELNGLYERGVREMKKEFGENFQQSYYHKMYDIQSRVGYMREFAKYDPEMIEKIVSYPWSGAHFSDRLWQNKQALSFHLREVLTQGTIQGKGIAAMSKEMSDKMGQSYKAAERLVRTETSHFHNEADKEVYEAAGVEEYEFMATLDERTCEVCGALDGKHFPLSEAQEGANFPPMHPNDRCTTIEYDPEDALDWAASGKPMPEDMTYEEWLERQNQGAEKEKNALDKEVEKLPEYAILNEEEQAATIRYVGGGSYALNAKLRKGIKLNKQEQEIMKDLDSGLEKLPVYKGIVTRDLKFDSHKRMKDYITEYIQSDFVTEQAFTSSTVGDSYHIQPDVRMVIHSKTGRDLRSYNPEEAEVLFQRNTRFRLISIKREGRTVLMEVEEWID